MLIAFLLALASEIATKETNARQAMQSDKTE
jgi:hypothetical protein